MARRPAGGGAAPFSFSVTVSGGADPKHAEEEDHQERPVFAEVRSGEGQPLPAHPVDDVGDHPKDRGGEHRGPERDPDRPECLHSASTGSCAAGGNALGSGGRKVKTSLRAAPSPSASTRTVPPPLASLPNSTSSASGFLRCSWMTRASGRAPNRRS